MKNDYLPPKISEMTAGQKNDLRVQVGFPGLPYPMASVRRDEDGRLQHTVDVIESSTASMQVYSHMSPERVNGILFREMPTPSMMLMLRNLVARTAPDSESRLMAIVGDAASGKSHLFRMVGRIVHPDGPIMVDCGGLNMHELLFRSVIDYGKGVKEQFERLVETGNIKSSTLAVLDEQFPGAIIRRGDKMAIDWDVIDHPQKKGQDGEREDSYPHVRRAVRILRTIYESEGLSVKENSFGITTVPGDVFESIYSGRPLFLDEFNKCKIDSLDKFHTFMEFVNGRLPSVTIKNTQASSDGESPQSITLHQSDLRAGWHMGIAGNDTSDGQTSRELNYSMETRLPLYRIKAPQLQDWEHRISQAMTGVPLATLHGIFRGQAEQNPEAFSQWLVDLRGLGLSADERKAIPAHQTSMLRQFGDTLEAVKGLAKYCYERQQLAHENAEVEGPLADELEGGRKQIRISFRKFIDGLLHDALQSVPDVQPASQATLSLNLADAFRNQPKAEAVNMPAWHHLGRNLARQIMEDIANDAAGMPATAAALLTICEESGVIRPVMHDAQPGGKRYIDELLHFDTLKDLGGTEDLLLIRNILVSTLKSRYGSSIQASDNEILPLENLGHAVTRFRDEVAPSLGEKDIVMPASDLDNIEEAPLVQGQAATVYADDEDAFAGVENLADFRLVLAAMALPEYGAQNRHAIWPRDIGDGSDSGLEEEAIRMLKGESDSGFDINILSVGLEKDGGMAEGFIYVIDDKLRGEMIAVGPADIPSAMNAALSKSGVHYVLKDDPASVEAVNGFLRDGARTRQRSGALEGGQAHKIVEGLLSAFSAVCNMPEFVEEGQVPTEVTMGQAIHKAGTPLVFTRMTRGPK